MRIDAISIGKNPPDEVNVLIEVAIGGEPIKYEMDKAAGTLFVDRFLYTPMRYPGNYGFIPHTLSEDGDPCDVLVANTRPLVPGSYIAVRPIGVMLMEDEGGGDEKIIAVPVPKLAKHVTKLGRNIKPAQMTDVLQRLKALDANRSNITLPKGPVPTNLKGARQNMRGR